MKGFLEKSKGKRGSKIRTPEEFRHQALTATRNIEHPARIT